MKKKIFILILVVIIVSIGIIAYLGKTILPSKIKTELTKTLETRLGRKFELGKIKFSLFKGILLENLVIYDNPKYNQKPLLNIEKTSINISWLSVLFQRKFIASSININKAELNIIHLTKDLWNFSDIIEQLSKQDAKAPAFIVYNIGISKTKVLFEDRTSEPVFLETIEDLNLKANISFTLDIKFNLDAKFKNKELYSLLYSNGTYSIRNKKLLAYLKIKDVALNEYYPYFKIKTLELKNGKLQDLDLKLTFENKKFEGLAKVKIDALNLEQEQIEFLSNINVDTNFTYEPDAKDKFSFVGNLTMMGGNYLKGVPVIGLIENISGAIAFDMNKIQTQDLAGVVLNCPSKLSGTIENLKNPLLNINLISDIKISNILNVIPKEIKSNLSEIDGNVKLELTAQGELRKINALDYAGKAKISDAFVKLNLLPEKLLNIQGDVSFNKNSINWQNLSCLYKDINVISNGSVNGFINPVIETALKSNLFDITTKINIDKNTVGISQLVGRYLNSNFNITGSLDIAEKENPILNLAISSDVELKDLKDILSKFNENISGALSKANLDGLCTLKGNLTGKLRDWQNWQSNLKANSKQISLYGFKLNNMQLQLTQTQNMIKDFSLTSVVYAGSLSVNVTMNLIDNFPFLMNMNLAGLDLSKLILDTPLKDKPISGISNLQAQINGNTEDILSMTGNGRFEIKDGELWELSLLKGLGNFLFIPEFDKIVFNAALGDFIIENKAVYTDNLKFISNELNLTCQGNVDFQSNLDFLVATEFSQELINDSRDLRKVITSALGQAADIVSVKLSGTLQKPKYTVIVNPVDLLKKILKGIDLNVF